MSNPAAPAWSAAYDAIAATADYAHAAAIQARHAIVLVEPDHLVTSSLIENLMHAEARYSVAAHIKHVAHALEITADSVDEFRTALIEYVDNQVLNYRIQSSTSQVENVMDLARFSAWRNAHINVRTAFAS